MSAKVQIKDVVTGRRTLLDNSQYNDEMRRWAAQSQQMAKRSASAMTKGKRRAPIVYQSGPKKGKVEHRLRTHIQYQLKADSGEVAGIAFKFPVHGIFREYGVGRGRRRGMLHTSMSDWLSGTLARQQDSLTEIVAEYQANRYIKVFMGVNK